MFWAESSMHEMCGDKLTRFEFKLRGFGVENKRSISCAKTKVMQHSGFHTVCILYFYLICIYVFL